jgi:hypothetical protein
VAGAIRIGGGTDLSRDVDNTGSATGHHPPIGDVIRPLGQLLETDPG